jgi:hypothetical protein
MYTIKLYILHIYIKRGREKFLSIRQLFSLILYYMQIFANIFFLKYSIYVLPRLPIVLNYKS